MMMLIAIISGIVTYRRIFADFFTFRPGKGQRSWLDGHTVAAVLALPYHLVITHCGLVTLMVMTLPWGIQAAYPNDPACFGAEAFGFTGPPARAGEPIPLTAIEPLIASASRQWDGGQVGG